MQTTPAYPDLVTTPDEDRPIFEAEQAPPTFWEQVRASVTPRRRGHLVLSETPGAKGVLVAIAKALVAGAGGVMLMLGVLGMGMSVLLGLYVLITAIGGTSIGVSWPVVPMSLVIFAVVGAIGYVLLRLVGMVSPKKKPRLH